MKANTLFLRALLLIGLAATGAASAIQTDVDAFVPLEPMDIHPRTSLNVVEQLARHHYVRRRIDDGLSSDIFDRYLELLDGGRTYFTAQDIQRFEHHRFALDDALKVGNLEPAYDMFNLYQERLMERIEFNITVLETGIDQLDFTQDEDLELDRSEAAWLTSRDAQRDLWRRQIKNVVLNMRLNEREQDEIGEVLLKRYRNRLSRSRQTNSEDAFQLYMNAVASSYDPHTQYFSPRTSENFTINMSLSLEGIGAVLRSEDEYTSVVRLVPAGPADKSGKLHTSDRIIGVGQGVDGEVVDVVGWRLDDVVDLIRGEAGSTVRLNIMPAADKTDSKSELIAITRDAVKLEEQSAQSKVLDIERNGLSHRIGIIEIPTFYIDFKALQEGDPEYKSTTRDVNRLIQELKTQDIDGLVIDLRNNGGGSLQEANALTGLFIKAGPTVQIRSASGRVDLFSDDDGDVAWEGPMAVLVNRLSASASEIFAGAIQDYQRGLIIGGQTFGKGTVQTLIPLNRGQLKMTQAKFYRVSGQSTQHQGVIPDIEYPQLFDHDRVGESSLDDALPWDVIRPTRYRREDSLAPMISLLDSRHQARVADDAEFNYLSDFLVRNREMQDRETITLNETKRRQLQDEDETWRLALENKRRVARGEPPVSSIEELEALQEAEDDEAADETAAAEGAEGEAVTADGQPVIEDADSRPVRDDEDVADADDEKVNDDALLTESGNILLDYITLAQSVAELGERGISDAAFSATSNAEALSVTN